MGQDNRQINTKHIPKRLGLNLIIELIIYGGLVTLYFLVVLRYLNEPIKNLFDNNLHFYAIVSLVLIVLQGVLLERLTFYILDWIGLKRFE
jgi:hypothetical protein